MRKIFLPAALLLSFVCVGMAVPQSTEGRASWYGEAYRGQRMANGEKFNPDRLTAASWFYPLGTQVRVTLHSHPERSVLVTITDRGPAKRLVKQGRIIDLTRAAFEKIAEPELGVVSVTVRQIESSGHQTADPPPAEGTQDRVG